jgi:4-amino-4-deoxy-L-arabinose transferase-like glycosyltransferase
MRTKSIFIALLYIGFSSFLVIQHEYINGEFYYYFFKSPLEKVYSNYFDSTFVKDWYGNVNKIIFPINYWFITIVLFLLNSVFNKSTFTISSAVSTFRYALILHFYILLATYASEIVPGFSILPGKIPPDEVIVWYQTFFIGTCLTLYYLFYFKLFIELIHSEIEWFKWSIIFSPVILIHLPLNSIHFYSFCIAMIVGCILIRKMDQIKKLKWNDVKWLSKYSIVCISILGLFIRIKYAEFFTSLGEAVLIFNADGETYYNAGKAFFEGKVKGNNFHQTPLYSLYLSVFFKLFGVKPSSVFFSQALLGSALPFIIYQILTKLKYSSAGLIAAFFVATDPLCIHYAISVNRSTPLLLTLPLIILSCINLEKNYTFVRLFTIGSLMGVNFYVGPETLPILLGIGSYIVYVFIKTKLDYKKKVLLTASFIIGVTIICSPINLMYYNVYGKWILMGRDSQADHSSTFFYNESPPIKKMIQMGFNPINDPHNSLELFFKKPLTIIQLIFDKLFIELPGFLLDPEAVYFAPIHLSMESFYGAHLQFYIYFFLIIGIFYLAQTTNIPFRYKTIIFGSILCQAVMTSIIIFGTNRFRAPIVPLNFIFVGLGIWVILYFKNNSINSINKLISIQSFSEKIVVIKNKSIYLIVLNISFLLAFTFFSMHSDKKNYRPNYKFSNWMTGINFKFLTETLVLKVNSGVTTFITNNGENNQNNFQVSIPVCNFLIPGKSPYLIFSIGNKFLGNTKRISRGCSVINAEIPFVKDLEPLYLYFYPSSDGVLDLIGGKNIMVNYYGKITPVRLFKKINLKNQITYSEVSHNYQKYSKGGLVIGRPKIE